MAKDKKSDSKADKGLLPKSIAGVKLPKDVRKKLLDLAQHPVVADLLAAGLVALAAKLKNEPKAGEAVAKVREKAVSAVQEVAKAAGGAVTAAVGAKSATPAVKRVRKPAAKPAATEPAAAKPAAAAKPRTTRRATPKAPKTPKTSK